MMATTEIDTSPTRAIEIMSPEEFLGDFRPYAIRNNKASSGDPSGEHRELFDQFMFEANQQLVEHLPEVLDTTAQSKAENQIRAFSKGFMTACRFVGLVAIRRERVKPEFQKYTEETDFRLGVMACMARDSLEMAKILSPNPQNVSPTTWAGIKPHFRGPDEVRKLVEDFPDLTLSLVLRALISKPVTVVARLEEYRATIARLRKDFPEMSDGQIHQAIVLRGSNPDSLLFQLRQRRETNPNIRTIDGLRTSTNSRKPITEVASELKIDPRFKDENIPNYVFNRAARRVEQDPSEYLEWFIETRNDLMEDFGMHGIGLIHKAVSEYPSDPREFCLKFVKNIEILSSNPRYAFLSKRERYSYAIEHPEDLEDALEVKAKQFEEIMGHPVYLSALGLNSIKRAIRAEGDPERRLRYVYLRPKYRWSKPWVVKSAVDLCDTLEESIIYIENFKSLTNGHWEIPENLEEVIRKYLPKEEFPDIEGDIIEHMLRNSSNLRQEAKKIQTTIDDLGLNEHPMVSRFGRSFLVTALTHHPDEPIGFLDDCETVYGQLASDPAYALLGAKTLLVTILRGPQKAEERLRKLDQETLRRIGDEAYGKLSIEQIRKQTTDDYLAGKLGI